VRRPLEENVTIRPTAVLAAAVALSACSSREIDEFPAKVGIVVPPGFFVSEVSAPFDIYAHAGDDKLDVFFVGETLDPIEGYYGEVITPDYTFEDSPDLDVLVAPSGGGSLDVDLENEPYIDYIRKQAKHAAYVTSHCWGAFALAAAGVLDGRQATTFPGYTDQLAKMFPKVDIVDDQRWVQDEWVVTSNGGLAAYEASLHVVEEILGEEAADKVAAGLVFDEANRDYSQEPKITSVPGSSEAVPTLAAPVNVAVLIMDGLFINEAIGPYDIYAHAGYGENVNVYFVAATMDPIVGYYGERITPHYTYADAPQADVLVVPSGGGSMDAYLQDQAMIDWVQTQAAGARWITSHCWGAFTLASAGLLDGKTVTTFPGYFDELRTAFPAIGEVVETSRVVRDGNIVTSNGGLAAYEAALYVMQQIAGEPTDDVIAGGLVFADANLENARTPLVVN
jgi:transcriptional regulator GlxA family with amidase domain